MDFKVAGEIKTPKGKLIDIDLSHKELKPLMKFQNKNITKTDLKKAIRDMLELTLNQSKIKEQMKTEEIEVQDILDAIASVIIDPKFDLLKAFSISISGEDSPDFSDVAVKAASETEEDLIFASEEDAIQYLSDLTGDKILIANEEKEVSDYEFKDLGVENEQYFRGATRMFTDWEDVFLGIGNSPFEAAEDALENAATTVWNVENISNNLSKEISVPTEDNEGMYQYVALYLK